MRGKQGDDSAQQLSLFDTSQPESRPLGGQNKALKKRTLPIKTQRDEPPSVVSGKQEERLTIRVPEAARILGISRSAAYEAVSRGEIPPVKIGRRVLIPLAAL